MNQESLKWLKHWMLERESIRIKKEQNLPAPWTTDTILRNYRFCNVRREDDTNSKWLIDNIALNDELTPENKIANIIAARMYNNLSTMKSLFPVDFYNPIDYNNIDKWLGNGTYLCNAYMPVNAQYAAGYFADKTGLENGKTPSGKAAYYRPTNLMRMGEEFVVLGVVKNLLKASEIEFVNSGDKEATIYRLLRELPTMGDFMAYQHFVDLTYIPELNLDENLFTIAGPGCVMGLQLLFAKELTDTYRKSNNTPDLSFPLTLDEFDPEKILFDLQETFHHWFPEWHDTKPTVMSLENCFCEFHKYMKVKMGWGTPRNKYDGGAQTPSLFDLLGD